MDSRIIISVSLFIFLLIFTVSAKIIPPKIPPTPICETYDKFGEELDTSKWEIRQDPEGQPLMDEYGILKENGSFVFHTKQNTFGDQRVYLFSKENFTTGESIEYQVNVVERNENSWWGQLTIITGSYYIRAGIVGYSTPPELNELGISNIKLTFESNNLKFERTAPSGELFIDNVPLSNSNGNYQMYIGTYNNDATVHIDYDNVKVCHFKK